LLIVLFVKRAAETSQWTTGISFHGDDLDSPAIRESSYSCIYDKYLQPTGERSVNCSERFVDWGPDSPPSLLAASDVQRCHSDPSSTVAVNQLGGDEQAAVGDETTRSEWKRTTDGFDDYKRRDSDFDGIGRESSLPAMSYAVCRQAGRMSPAVAERDVAATDGGSQTGRGQGTDVTAGGPRYRRSFLDRVDDMLPPPPRRGAGVAVDCHMDVDSWFSGATAAASKRDTAVVDDDARIDASPEMSTASSSWSVTAASAGFRRMRTSLTRFAAAAAASASGSRQRGAGRRRVSFMHESKC
jgi:hypothetical protein